MQYRYDSKSLYVERSLMAWQHFQTEVQYMQMDEQHSDTLNLLFARWELRQSV